MFATFKWKTKVENQTNKIKRLRFDNGGEYLESKFKIFCAGDGIILTRIVPNKPGQNGAADRMNITLNEWAIKMRIHYDY